MIVLATSSTEAIRYYASKSSSDEKTHENDAAGMQTAHSTIECNEILIWICLEFFEALFQISKISYKGQKFLNSQQALLRSMKTLCKTIAEFKVR